MTNNCVEADRLKMNLWHFSALIAGQARRLNSTAGIWLLPSSVLSGWSFDCRWSHRHSSRMRVVCLLLLRPRLQFLVTWNLRVTERNRFGSWALQVVPSVVAILSWILHPIMPKDEIQGKREAVVLTLSRSIYVASSWRQVEPWDWRGFLQTHQHGRSRWRKSYPRRSQKCVGAGKSSCHEVWRLQESKLMKAFWRNSVINGIFLQQLASLPRKLREDGDEVSEYASVVGRSLSQKMLLFRC